MDAEQGHKFAIKVAKYMLAPLPIENEEILVNL
jgi:hypothetical protein